MSSFHGRIAGTTVAAVLALSPAAALAQAIATADGEQPGLRIDITELKRTSGDTVTLRATLVNDSGSALSPYSLFGGSDLSDVHLIDAAGKKKYLTIKDASGNCVCTTGIGGGMPGGQNAMNLWARFPAPPADVTEVSVIFPHFIPTDAPIAE